MYDYQNHEGLLLQDLIRRVQKKWKRREVEQ